jgi:hypothetical protein
MSCFPDVAFTTEIILDRDIILETHKNTTSSIPFEEDGAFFSFPFLPPIPVLISTLPFSSP